MHRENPGTAPEHRVTKGRLFVLSGASASGKDTLRERALSDIPGLVYSISCTTREETPEDRLKQKYRFLSREEFERLIAQDFFFEHAEYGGNLYGSPKQPVIDALNAGHDVLLEIEVQGAMKVKALIPEAVMIFIDVPIETLRRRMKSRGREDSDKQERRLKKAEQERQERHKYDYIINNDDGHLEQACRELRRIVTGHELG